MSDLGNKEIMAKNIEFYMALKGVDRVEVCKAIDVPYTTFTDWTKGKTYPRIDKIERLARYFNISKSALVENRENNKEEEPSYYLDKEANDVAQFLFENKEYGVLFDAVKNVKKEDIEFVKEMIDRIKK